MASENLHASPNLHDPPHRNSNLQKSGSLLDFKIGVSFPPCVTLGLVWLPSGIKVSSF